MEIKTEMFKQVRPNETYKHLHSKENIKTQPTEWEEIFTNYAIERGFISKIYKQLNTAQYKKYQ